MVEGILCINMNPPYVSFAPSSSNSVLRRDCSVDEVLAILREVSSIHPSEEFSPKDFTIVQPTTLSYKTLARFGLGKRMKDRKAGVPKVVSLKDGFCATVLEGDCYEECSCFDFYQIESEDNKEQVS